MTETVPGIQWRNWAERIGRGEHLEEEMQNAGVLPHADTPPPPTNATLHVLVREDGYGTPERRFTMLCGQSWRSRDSDGSHKFFYGSESFWHKHVNCDGCLKLITQGWRP